MTGSVISIIITFTGMIYVASIGMAYGIFKLAEDN